MDYPVWDIAIGGGMLMAVVAITHVIVSHFAIGGGLLIVVTEMLGERRRDQALLDLARRGSLLLILISTVFGAISGVGIWVVAGLVSPAAIASLIHTYVWGWAIEWVFFVVEIVAALIYYATWDRLPRRAHVAIGWVYFAAAYLSLVVINGIITFMLTPGDWLVTGEFWDGFFNPTYWPALVLRSGIVVLMAVAFLALAANRAAGVDRPRLGRYLGWWVLAGVALTYGGVRWWEAALPEGVRALFLGATPALATLASTRQLVLWSLAVVLLLAVLMVAVPKSLRWATAAVLAVAAFTSFGAYERLREGTRKPYMIRDFMFSNGLRVGEVAAANERGSLVLSGWTTADAGADPVAVGRQVFRRQCASCHTLDGYQAIRPLLPSDPDMMVGPLMAMWEMGAAWTELAPGQTVAPAGVDYPFMPPLVGSEEEIMALAEYLKTLVPATAGGAS